MTPSVSLTSLLLAVGPGDLGLVVPDALHVENELIASTSGTAGGRLDIRGSFDGVPLMRRVARVWLAADGTPLVVTRGTPVAPLVGGVSPSVDLAEALAILEDSGLSGSRGAITGRLVVDARAASSRLAWRVDPPVDPVRFDNQVFLVDAHTGDVRIAFNRTRQARVEVYPVSPVETPVAEIVELNDVDDTAEFLEGQFFRVRNCVLSSPDVACTYAPTLTPDVMGDFLYPVPDIAVMGKNQARDDAYAEVSAYYNADRFHRFLADLGDPGLACSQGETRTTITVNTHFFADGEPQWFSNAFYTGDCSDTVVMGQGEDVDFAWDGDIVLHELGHGITDRQTGDEGTLGLGRRDEHSAGNDAGAINEGTSDYFGNVISGDRIYGNYTGEQFIRDLGTDASCPAGLPVEIHDDGIVWASALLDITDVVGHEFVPVVIDTLGMLPFDVSFDVAAETLETIARDALGDTAGDVVAEVMTERGLADCVRVAPIEDAVYGMWLLPASWNVDYSPVRPPPFQVVFNVPPNAVSLTFSFEPFDFLPEGVEKNWAVDVVLKDDEPIIFSYEEATGVTYVDADSTAQHSIEGNSWTFAVQGGEEIHAAFLNRGLGLVRMDDMTVEYEIAETDSSTSGPEPETGESSESSSGTPPATSSTTVDESAGTSSAETSGDAAAPAAEDGCGCRSSAPHPLALLLLLFLRRRRG